jgi:hypothetical protein
VRLFRNDFQLVKRSKLFDPVYYLMTYPDVRIADVDPLRHFITIGWKEGRNPSSTFNTSHYLEKFADVRAAHINPLVHFILYGKKDGR